MHKLPNRLRPDAVLICQRAEEEVKNMLHPYCDSVHLLLGAFRRKDSKPVMALLDAGFNIGDARFFTRRALKPVRPGTQPGFSNAYLRAIDEAVKLADVQSLGASVGPKELVAGIILSGSPLVNALIDRTGKSAPRFIQVLGYDWGVLKRR